jgi:4-diphosphocytidyl-2-C-methyl-D-erythritol kinase
MIVEAPAKINLTLEVTGVEENGYHTLDTLFAWLDLHDTLELSASTESRLEIRAEGVDTAAVGADESNLVLRALRALERHCARELPTRMLLTKRIPAGGGLGGGSADAAAALLGLTQLHELSITRRELQGLAAGLGADVAFGLVGGFARGRGYGEQLEPLPLPPDLKGCQLVLLAPEFACPTPAVYRSWDREPGSAARGSSDRFLNASTLALRWKQIANDLQPAAERLFPRLAELRQSMKDSGLEGVSLSGSGSTLFGFVPQEGSAEEIQKRLQGLGTVVLTGLREDGRGEQFPQRR